MAHPKIDPEFRDLLGPASALSDEVLRAMIRENEGGLFPVTTWNGYAIDGQRTLKFCTELDLPYETIDMTPYLLDRDAVKDWMARREIASRSIQDKTVDKLVAWSEIHNTTIATLAKGVGMSESSIKRARRRARALDKIPDEYKKTVENSGASAPTVAKFSELPARRQDKVAELVKDKVYPTLSKAITATEPANTVDAAKQFEEVIRLIGAAKKEADRLYVAYKNQVAHKAFIEILDQAELALREWKGKV